jgi:DNA-directed RNA polymerase subunit M/transcription elongation factor TFIIS
MPLEFCSVCENYLYLDTSNDKLTKSCKTCGYQKETTEGSLITETVIQAQSSEDYRYVVNEFTKQDPRLPRFKNLKCPKPDCPTQNGVPSEVIVIKYDQKNLRFVYICSVCDETWRSGTR